MPNKTYTLSVICTQKGYEVTVSEVGCTVSGATLDEAVANAHQMIDLVQA